MLLRIGRFLHIGTLCGLFVMMSLTVADVLLRFFLNSPIIGSTELVELLMVTFGLGWSFCTLQGVHIRAEFVYSRMPRRARRILEWVWDFLSMIVNLVLTWRLYQETMWAMREKQVSPVLNFPTYPAWLILTVCFGSLTITFFWRLFVYRNSGEGR